MSTVSLPNVALAWGAALGEGRGTGKVKIRIRAGEVRGVDVGTLAWAGVVRYRVSWRHSISVCVYLHGGKRGEES